MTSEKKFVAGIEDIKALTLECSKCKARLTFSLSEKPGAIPFTCPGCNVEWRAQEYPYGANEPKVAPALKFISAVYMLRFRKDDPEQKPVGFRVLLEFDEPR
jgi:hypothetical protein